MQKEKKTAHPVEHLLAAARIQVRGDLSSSQVCPPQDGGPRPTSHHFFSSKAGTMFEGRQLGDCKGQTQKDGFLLGGTPLRYLV